MFMPNSPLELNVGGTFYTSTKETLTKVPGSRLAQLVEDFLSPVHRGDRLFIDRDGALFRFVLLFLHQDELVLPDKFNEVELLRNEANYYGLCELTDALSVHSQSAGAVAAECQEPCCITVGYRGTFAYGRDGVSDLRFRKLTRILVAGRIPVCHQVFGETLNDSRDPDVGNVYSARFFLKHSNLEQAFDDLYRSGFRLVSSCGTGTGGPSADVKMVQDPEETRWQHYNEFIFVRQP